MNGVLTVEKLKGPPFFPPRPHVVILGAGASKAAFPNGDLGGRLLPLLKQIPDILGDTWRNLLKEAKPPGEGFEAQFSWLRRQGNHAEALSHIEHIIEDYFSQLQLPETPTIYDYILLGLRPKDIVATFNWDPLLLLANVRNRKAARLPDVRFLHGCVAYATCREHDVLGTISEMCPKCREPLVRGPLLYPDNDKDYTKDSLIQRDWKVVTERLQSAFHLTIFGYSGPVTDFNARKLLLDGWTKTPFRDISHVEIVDIRSPEELTACWKEFIPFHHDMVVQDFWSSTVARWPRRTAEYKLSASIYGIPAHYVGPHRTESLRELQDWHREIAATELPIDESVI